MTKRWTLLSLIFFYRCILFYFFFLLFYYVEFFKHSPFNLTTHIFTVWKFRRKTQMKYSTNKWISVQTKYQYTWIITTIWDNLFAWCAQTSLVHFLKWCFDKPIAWCKPGPYWKEVRSVRSGHIFLVWIQTSWFLSVCHCLMAVLFINPRSVGVVLLQSVMPCIYYIYLAYCMRWPPVIRPLGPCECCKAKIVGRYLASYLASSPRGQHLMYWLSSYFKFPAHSTLYLVL